ncbi:VWA domain-containing protein [Natronospirillum operosum]|uniref:VWA domain-containing protein n=1 Tax=Natronospirillum operosum TaxID=2759953 RepID=A0A4Z0W572_9GAMM|nr:VWA domain-containing protein [Natronospirillum operosum]TGG90734.1 VWA domain-containing protein [Natronospirillum operosum]
MSDKSLRPKSDSTAIDQFINEVRTMPQSGGTGQGRLIFALDATASREPTWDQACDLQSELFSATRDLGGLAIQLCYYRGYGEFKATRFVSQTDQLLQLMNGVRCLGGRTQIGRVLSHAAAETRDTPVKAAIFIGDCCEEPVDQLCHTAGELGMLRTPVFMFHEGHDAHAKAVFEQISKLSGGAYVPFDRSSPRVLKELLAAVAVYASGGSRALEDFSRRGSADVKRLTQQIR